MLHYYIAHQEEVIVRRTRYELAKAEERAHILEGLIIAPDNIDEIIHIIRSSQTDKEAAERMTELDVRPDGQADRRHPRDACARLTGLEHQKIEDEVEGTAREDRLLQARSPTTSSCDHQGRATRGEEEVRQPRRTLLSEAARTSTSNLIAEESMVVTMTKAGYTRSVCPGLSTASRSAAAGIGGEPQGQRLRGAPVRGAPTHLHAVLLHEGQKVYRLR